MPPRFSSWLASFIVVICLPISSFAQSLSEAEITKLVEGDLKVASKELEQSLEQNPDDAQLYMIAGNVYAVRAQNASIISAPGLARKTLKSYQKAVELEPNNTRYRMALMQFYSFAPGIVGGSSEKALEQQNAIQELDKVSGTVAQSILLIKDKDNDGLAKLFNGLEPTLRDHPRIKMAEANYLRSTEQFEQAAPLIQTIIQAPAESLANEFERLLPYQAMLQAGFLGIDSEAHLNDGIKAFEQYLAEAPVTHRLSSKKWVRLFLSRAYANAGEEQRAKTMLNKLQAEIEDKSLQKEIKKTLKELG